MKQIVEAPTIKRMPASEISRTDGFYREGAQSYFEKTIDVQMDHLYRPFLKLVRSSGRILDVGCGSGRDVKKFRSLGYEAFGIDQSPELVALASAHIGPYFSIARAETYKGDVPFDAVWACASLLHLPREELLSAIENLASLLNPRGIFFASVQAGTGDGVQADGRRYTYYSAAEFEDTLRRAGFLVLESWITKDAMRANGPSWVNVLARLDRRHCR
ncbi:MAG: class I SAM-dependent methyltransferase [Paucibacter sp.]|nr:class I SAM-dependent methyltransferase [Roseateles sp.]